MVAAPYISYGWIEKKEEPTMTRPKKEKELTRSHHITLRLTDTEYELVTDNAIEAGLSRSDYLRKMILDGKINVRYDIVVDLPELQKLVSEFGKIGGNLNQIAKYFHTGGIRSMAMQDEISQCITDLYELRKEVKRMAGDFHGNIKTHRK